MSAKVDLKVVIVGMSGVGKTCLLERYLHQRFVEIHTPTVGAGFGAKRVVVGNQSVLMGLWDTAGSDLRNGLSYAKLRFWITQLTENEPECQIYIAGLKLDLIEKSTDRAVPEEEISALVKNAKIVDRFECSSKTGAGVEDIFNEVARKHIAKKRELEQNRDLVNIQRNTSSGTASPKPCC